LTTGDDIIVEVRNLRKSYGDQEVLHGVGFDVLRGKTNVIIGPSGSGKSVMMRQLIRLERPDSGQILFDGGDIAQVSGKELSKLRRRFGMVFQHSALFDFMNVFENVAFPLREHTRLSRGEIRDRVFHRLTTLGIADAAEKMPPELSGGMQRRVAVARALILETELVVYDEPTTGLDPLTTRTVDELILETADAFGHTSVVISHDMASVFRIADAITVLDFGNVVASTSPDRLLDEVGDDIRDFILASGVSPELLRGARRTS
jgi:phospholipid/cholesterol/gamma-HCH transport system ATP-binding protein